MATWTADADCIIRGVTVRARNADEADDVVYDLADRYVFDPYVPMDADSAGARMIGAKRVPGSEDSRGIPLMKGDVRITLGGMTLTADSEGEAEAEFMRCLEEWDPGSAFDRKKAEYRLFGPSLYDEDDCEYYDEEDWSIRSKASKSVRRRFFPEGMTSYQMAEAIARELIACGLDKDYGPDFDVYDDCYWYMGTGDREDFVEWADAVRPRSPKAAAMIGEAIAIFDDDGSFDAIAKEYARLNPGLYNSRSDRSRAPKRKAPAKKPVSNSGKTRSPAKKKAPASKSVTAKPKAKAPAAKKKPAVSKSVPAKKKQAPAKKALAKKPASGRR